MLIIIYFLIYAVYAIHINKNKRSISAQIFFDALWINIILIKLVYFAKKKKLTVMSKKRNFNNKK